MYLKTKRLIDIILSILGIIVLSPVFLIIAIFIKLDSKGPVLFRQKRVGIHKNYFNILKFRTMRIDSPQDIATHLLENTDKWVTRVGKFLRKTSLDELPQFINILKGEMTIVGPRPALWNQYDLIAKRDKYGVNDIPVGLTGWAQINGRDEISIDEKVKLDGEYVTRRSLSFDFMCFIGTIGFMFRGNDISQSSRGIIGKMIKEKEEDTNL